MNREQELEGALKALLAGEAGAYAAAEAALYKEKLACVQIRLDPANAAKMNPQGVSVDTNLGYFETLELIGAGIQRWIEFYREQERARKMVP